MKKNQNVVGLFTYLLGLPVYVCAFPFRTTLVLSPHLVTLKVLIWPCYKESRMVSSSPIPAGTTSALVSLEMRGR
jgi:hypothetical protein